MALPLVVLSLLWLSWQFLSLAQAQGFETLWNRQGAGGMGVLPALDLVIAMPISWLPLVADYARHGKNGSRLCMGSTSASAVQSTATTRPQRRTVMRGHRLWADTAPE